ncbi:peptide/nitrate transporter [Acrasis kona]|uniref:Peptide/nitrate transporter n=1 Tax=Acrasis kona TaxID=1008807 RepID=A0AAW2YYU6_9EUKA
MIQVGEDERVDTNEKLVHRNHDDDDDVEQTPTFAPVTLEMEDITKVNDRFKDVPQHEPPPEATTPTPMPWKQIVVVFTIFICDIFALSTLSPIVGFMVVDFGLAHDVDDNNIGYYAGMIISAYPLGQFFFAFMWGYLSDKYGRRPILMIGIVGSAFCSLLFGFSTNIYWAVAVRAILGALNGNNGIFKTYLGEITDKSNQARAFSMIGLSFGIGNVFGPIISGFAARPHIQYPNLFVRLSNTPVLSSIAQLFTTFPYLFLNLIVFLVNLIGLILAIFFLKETNRAILDRREPKQDIEMRETEVKVEPPMSDEETQEQELQQQAQEEVFNTMFKFTIPRSQRVVVIKFPEWWPRNEIVRTRPPLTCSLIQTMGAVCNQGFMASSPLWMMLSYENRGLNFGTQELGIMGTILGVAMFLYQLLLCHVVLSKFGILNSLRVSCVIMAVIYPFFPEINLLTKLSSIIPMWAVLVLANIVRIVIMQTVMTGCNIMLNNSVSPQNMGKLNGVALSINAIGRAFGPIAATTVFSYSIYGTKFPFDIHLIFILLSCILLSMVLMTIRLPKSLNEPRKHK